MNNNPVYDTQFTQYIDTEPQLPAHLSEIIKLRSLLEPLKYIAVMAVIALLPQAMPVFVIICLIVLYFCLNNPVRSLYIATAIISFRYFFVIHGTDWPTFAPWRVRNLGDTFIQFSDEFVFVLLLFAILMQFVNRQINLLTFSERRRLRINILFFCALAILSGLANQVSPVITFFFLQLFLRPVLFLVLILSIRWKEYELFRYFVFIFTITFLLQVFPSFLENIILVAGGRLFFIDMFTGTFVFPFNLIAVQLLFYSLCILFVNYLQRTTSKNLRWLLLCFFSIISSQSGFQTGSILIGLLPFLFMVFLRPQKLDLPIIKSKFTMIWAAAILGLLVIGIVLMPELPGYEDMVGYSEYAGRKAIDEGIAETPKIRTFEILFDYIAQGEINFFIGAGPGQYLSGAAGLTGNPYMSMLVGNTGIFSGGLFSGVLSFPYNNFVGLIGEAGIFAYIVMLLIYFLPIAYVWRNLSWYRGTFWSTVASGFIGVFLAMFVWSFFWNVFEDIAMSVFYFIIGGILISACEIIKNRFQNYYT
jgi:hypothetical protein